jgi:small subunit ribosomal protein S20
LANHKSALKRIRITERRRVRNRFFISRARTEIRRAREVIAVASTTGERDAARKATLDAIRTLDKAVSKGILHRNNAARRKSRLMKRLAALDAAK